MTQRITDKMLQGQVDRINKILGRPLTSYSKDENGNYHPNAGNFHLSWAYGGVELHEMSHTPGCTGIIDVFMCGHGPKRKLYNRLTAFIRGLELKNSL